MPTVYSGQVEPTWIAKKGALVYEDVFAGSATPATGTTTGGVLNPTGPGTLPQPIIDRYQDNRIER